MKNNDIRYSGAQRVLVFVTAVLLIANSGCNIAGFLLSPGAFEKKIEPQYNLQARQERGILVWIECPHSSNVDYDVQQKLMAVFQVYLKERAGIREENVYWHTSDPQAGFAQDPVEIARSTGAGYVLLVQVDEYELVPLKVRNYYAGQMLSHAALLDTDLGMTVWPKNAAARTVHVGVDLETNGRDAALSRLVSATAHCVMRTLYPCEKMKFKIADEKISIQDAYEMETF